MTAADPRDGLLPCPFCGAAPVAWDCVDRSDGFRHGTRIECSNCPAFQFDGYADEAIANWNRRFAHARPEAVGYLSASGLNALRACSKDDHNGWTYLWMRPDSDYTVPVYLGNATLTPERAP